MTHDRRHSRTRGQAMVEFAIVAPIFFLLLFGIIEGARFIFYYEMLGNATRDGARYAIVHGANSSCPSGPMPNPPLTCYDAPGDNVVDRVEDAASGAFGSSLSVTLKWLQGSTEVPGNNSIENSVNVAATYTYHTILPLIPFPAITIEAESRLVINN